MNIEREILSINIKLDAIFNMLSASRVPVREISQKPEPGSFMARLQQTIDDGKRKDAKDQMKRRAK